MIKKYGHLLLVLAALMLLLTATQFYPGGSQVDKNSIGYDFKNNYISNLFSEKAVNGADNASRNWAISGVFLLCVSFALIFNSFSKKIPLAKPSKIIRYTGVGASILSFFIVTPWHDAMLTFSGILALISMFYIAVFIFKSKLHLFKLLCFFCLLVFYSCNYIYYTRTGLVYLPIMQKVLMLLIILWMLGLEYFCKADDFKHLKRSIETNNT